MRLPRARVTVRGMIIAVAITALLLFLQTGRYRERITRADLHRYLSEQYLHSLEDYEKIPGTWMLYNGSGPTGRGRAVTASRRVYRGDPILKLWSAQYKARSDYHARMAVEWRREAWQVWKAMPTDPAPPPVPFEILIPD